MRSSRLFLVLALFAGCAAGPTSTKDDAGTTNNDAGVNDTDAGSVDAGDVDTDAGTTDAGVNDTDAGTTDAGTNDTDAGTTDAGPTVTDAGPVDAGTVTPDGGFTGDVHGQWIVNGDLVHDSVTGLTWDRTEGPGSGSFSSGTGHYKWQEAKTYCQGKGARLATYADPPTDSESVALSVAANADWANFSAAFGGTWNAWSASEVDGVSTKAWHYYIDQTGSAVGYKGFKDDGYKARCVR